MTNEFYNHDDGYPAFNAQGASAAMRAQFDKLGLAFDKFPALTGKASYVWAVNAGETAVEAVLSTGTGNIVRATAPTFTLTDVTTNDVSTLQHGWAPKLPGGTTTFLRGDGTWAAQANASMISVPRTSNTIIAGTETSKLIDFTGSTNFTQTFTAHATLASGFFCYLRNSGTADIELAAPAAVSTTSTTSNSISAGTNWTLPAGLAISANDLIVLRRTADPYNQRITGTVTSYNSGSGALVMVATARVGSGTFTDWTIATCAPTAGIDNLPSFVMYQGEVRCYYINDTGTAAKTFVVKGFYRKATASYLYIHPPGYSAIDWDAVGGAGGPGSGRKGAAGSIRLGGSPGGTPGRTRCRFAQLTPGTGYQQNIGAAGTSGSTQTVNSTDGNPGTAGGNTTFGSIATAYGGVAGIGGTAGAGATGFGLVSGSGSLSAGTAQYGTTTSISDGGQPSIKVGNTILVTRDAYGEGGASAQTSAAGNSIFGGAASISGDTTATTPLNGGSSMYGIPGGGFGGWVTAADTMPAAACRAGTTGSWAASGAAGGTCGAIPTAGANGAANAGTDFDMGNSGGGGGSTNTASVNGQPGGNGSSPGGAGGGGGACLNGAGNSGAGGTSAAGQSITIGVV